MTDKEFITNALTEAQAFADGSGSELSVNGVLAYVEQFVRKYADAQNDVNIEDELDSDPIFTSDYTQLDVEAKKIDSLMPQFVSDLQKLINKYRISTNKIVDNFKRNIIDEEKMTTRLNNKINDAVSEVFTLLPNEVVADYLSKAGISLKNVNSESAPTSNVQAALEFPKTHKLTERQFKSYIMHLVNRAVYQNLNEPRVGTMLENDPVLNGDLSKTQAKDFAPLIPEIKKKFMTEYKNIYSQINELKKDKSISKQQLKTAISKCILFAANRIQALLPNVTRKEIAADSVRSFRNKQSKGLYRNVYIKPNSEKAENVVKELPQCHYENANHCYVVPEENVKNADKIALDSRMYKSRSDLANGKEMSYEEKILLFSSEQLRNEAGHRNVMTERKRMSL